MKLVFLLIGGPLFLIATVFHIWVRMALNRNDPELEEVYHEFEEQHVSYQRYLKWYHISLWVASLSLLLLFLGFAV